MCQTGGDEIFVETVSGANRTRPELEQLLQTVREGDTVVIVKLDRLSCSRTDSRSVFSLVRFRTNKLFQNGTASSKTLENNKILLFYCRTKSLHSHSFTLKEQLTYDDRETQNSGLFMHYRPS